MRRRIRYEYGNATFCCSRLLELTHHHLFMPLPNTHKLEEREFRLGATWRRGAFCLWAGWQV